MTDELNKVRSPDDITEAEAGRYAEYQQLTLEDPDEVWLEETETGERHFTFIGRFSHGDKKFSYIVVCLALEGVPSFIFLSFPTRDENLVDEYRKGVDLRVDQEAAVSEDPDGLESVPSEPGAELPEHISDLERLYRELRQPGDIPREEFEKFQAFFEPTMDDPDEIWQFVDAEGNEWYTFIARHVLDPSTIEADKESMTDAFTMIVVCEPAFDEDGNAAHSFEVIFGFPTTDPALVQYFRKGINSLNKAFGVGWTGRRAA